MNRQILTAPADTPIQQVPRMMEDAGALTLLVVDTEGLLLGAISWTDVAARLPGDSMTSAFDSTTLLREPAVSEIDDIRRQMAQIRHDLHQDVSSVVGGVSEVVTEVEEVMDWRSVIRNHPYLDHRSGLGGGVSDRAAADEGRDPKQSRTNSSPRPLRKPPASRRKRFRPMSWALNLLWPIATQAAQSYAMIWIENQLKDHLQMGPDDIRRNRTQGRDFPFGPGQFR